MSGTSADGVDVALVQLEGRPPALKWDVLGFTHVPYPEALRAEVFAAFRPETSDVSRLCELNMALGRVFGEAALRGIADAGLTPEQVDLIGSHGQTVWHRPPSAPGHGLGATLQIGEAALIAEITGLPVVSNFRARDMAAGGHGAPLVAWVDVLLLTDDHMVRAAQNIGGIANVTYLPPRLAREPDMGEALAFDTGPGNMLIDDAASRATQGRLAFDRDGALAARGRVDQALLDELLDHPYFAQAPPKTTGRETFGTQYGKRLWSQATARGLRPEDVVATLTALTARSIGRAYRQFLPRFPDEVIVSGGGARNPTLMHMLRDELRPARVLVSDEVGLSATAKEAVAFAVLAYETWHGRAGNLPSATGATRRVVLGQITPGGRRLTVRVEEPHEPPAASRTADTSRLTEASNPATEAIDTLPTLEMVRLMNAEDRKVAEAVAEELPRIAAAIEAIAARMRQGGRLIYVGAGTSGRLGVLDASECPPTFGVSPGRVVGVIAGGLPALTTAVERAEDRTEDGSAQIAALQVDERDTVVGIAASGSTPFVIGAMEEARKRGALVISLACNRPTPIEAIADIAIAPLVGPEVITGSTRLKAGTAQKMVLNMLSTGVMVKLGKTFGNLMVDLQATNAKLTARARRIVVQAYALGRPDAPPLSEEEAARILEQCDGEVKTAIVSLLADVPPEEARAQLRAVDGVVRYALEGSS